jgi:hypothetical protein
MAAVAHQDLFAHFFSQHAHRVIQDGHDCFLAVGQILFDQPSRHLQLRSGERQ